MSSCYVSHRMPCRHAYIVQGFERLGSEVEHLPSREYGSAHQAVLDAARLALEMSGVIVVHLAIDLLTGMPLDGPYCLAQFGSIPPDYHGLPGPSRVWDDVH